ncbi:hypothetical protein WMY93_011619 [Mugilogobius chulae]|uniref:Uncharacterized protein n=1 Tax=Mugilogobius chulae TaxID=88201 RepID=A0AAW0P981_9GOBI
MFMFLLVGVLGFFTLIIIMAKLGRASAGSDPNLDPLLNPNIREDEQQSQCCLQHIANEHLSHNNISLKLLKRHLLIPAKMEKRSTPTQHNMKMVKGHKMEKFPQRKNYNQNNFHKHSDVNDSHDNSTTEDSVFNDPPHDNRHHDFLFHKQNHSLSTSSTSITSSSSSSSSTSSCSSFSSSSYHHHNIIYNILYLSSFSSDSDSSNPRVKPQHSRSCTDISRKNQYFDECDDTAPLLEKGERADRNLQDLAIQSGSCQSTHKTVRDGSVRKAKSMESLARPKLKEPQDGAEQDKIKNEARKNIVKEKIKFSAFLNEITRQNNRHICKEVQIQQVQTNAHKAAVSIHTLTKGTTVIAQQAHRNTRKGEVSRGIIHGPTAIGPAHHQASITILITTIITVNPITTETIRVNPITMKTLIVSLITFMEIITVTLINTDIDIVSLITMETIRLNPNAIVMFRVIIIKIITETPITMEIITVNPTAMGTVTMSPIITVVTITMIPTIPMETITMRTTIAMEIIRVNPITRETIMVTPITRETINMVRPITMKTIITVRPITRETIITVRPITRETINTVRPITRETITVKLVITLETITVSPIMVINIVILITRKTITKSSIVTTETITSPITMETDIANSKPNQCHTNSYHHGIPAEKTLDSLRNSPRPVSASSQDEEQTSFSNPLHKESVDEMGRIIILQEQNEGLQQSLLKTAVRVECLGEEFMSSRHCLEADLQKTRMELSNLTERFKRLHDNCSSTQQTNNLLEHKLHLVAQSMEGERERLNKRISGLTERLADAQFVNNVDINNCIDSEVDLAIAPVAPPPAQFMDSLTYAKDKVGTQEQSLGSVPEEEESDWSEIASLEEIPFARHSLPKELRGTEAMLDLHHSGAEALYDCDNEFIHNLKSSRDMLHMRQTDSSVSEMDAAMSNLHSAERILNHLISETQSSEAESHGWIEAIPDKLLTGERTQL